MRDAADCQISELYHQLYWEGATSTWADGSEHAFADARLLGPCPKYRTYLREVEVGPIAGNRQTVHLKSITTRVTFGGRYSGDYTVSRVSHVCERRNSEWRILSSTVHSRNDLVNEAAAAEFRRTGGWDGDLSTPDY